MRLVFMGTGPISAASLLRIIEAGHALPLVVTRPDRPRGRSGKPAPPEVKVVAERHGLAVHQPERVREETTVEILRDLAPMAIVVVAYNQLLPPVLLQIPPRGCINVHLSLLPRYRGAAPIQHAILAGDDVTGVTVMRMAERFDTGPILRQREVSIGPAETTGELSPRLASAGASLLVEVLADLEKGPIDETPQDASVASRAPLLRKKHGAVDWTRSANDVRNQVRAMTPWPTAYTFLRRDGGEASPVRLILLATSVTGDARTTAPPGEIVAASAEGLLVAAGGGTVIRLDVLKKAGSRALDARSLLNGCPIAPGDRLSGIDG